jgi:hypothetical protein
LTIGSRSRGLRTCRADDDEERAQQMLDDAHLAW